MFDIRYSRIANNERVVEFLNAKKPGLSPGHVTARGKGGWDQRAALIFETVWSVDHSPFAT